MNIFARASLIPAARAILRDVPAVVLEGSWPSDDCGRSSDTTHTLDGNGCFASHPNCCWSLDDTLNATHGWIDDEAIRLASQIAEQTTSTEQRQLPPVRLARRRGNRGWLLERIRRMVLRAAAAYNAPSPSHVHERKLRYYLAKLLRVVAFFDQPPPGLVLPQREVCAHLASGRDDDYAALLSLLAQRHGWQLSIIWYADAPPGPAAKRATFVRRLAGRAHRWTVSRSGAAGPRLVLCGNAAGLDPLCQQLLARHSRVAWLYDEFCLRTWRRWRRDGVHQLLCRSEGARLSNRRAAVHVPESIVLGGMDLAPAIAPWLRTMDATWADRIATLTRRIAAQFERFRPAMLIVDEDQTPLPRIAVEVARQMGIPSAVVQHGVPRVAFGFAPLAADWFLAWGDTSRQQLETFGCPADRIAVTGSPRHDSLALAPRWRADACAAAPREVLFFATTPASDARPEPLRFGLTTAEHDRLVRMACQEVAAQGAQLVVKTHPRAAEHAAALGKILLEFPQLDYRIVSTGNLTELCQSAACAISLASGAGIDAAGLGLPVVELVPRGGADLMPAAAWGTWATASDAASLRAFFQQAGLDGSPPVEPLHALARDVSRVFANWGHAAGATADAVVSLALGEQPGGPHGLHIPRPRFAVQAGGGSLTPAPFSSLTPTSPPHDSSSGAPHRTARRAERGPQSP